MLAVLTGARYAAGRRRRPEATLFTTIHPPGPDSPATTGLILVTLAADHDSAVAAGHDCDCHLPRGVEFKLHGGRRGCVIRLHVQGVPGAVIAAWIGHKDANLTTRLCAHSQFAALKDAGSSCDIL
jgi:integrase